VKKLKKRRKKGIECPFFESDINQHINNLASRLMVDNDKFNDCIVKVAEDEKKSLNVFVKEIFDKSPISRLFLQYKKGKNKIYIRGSITNADSNILNKFCDKKQGYYSCHLKYTKRVQIYLVTGY
jgi:hypothetical protein